MGLCESMWTNVENDDMLVCQIAFDQASVSTLIVHCNLSCVVFFPVCILHKYMYTCVSSYLRSYTPAFGQCIARLATAGLKAWVCCKWKSDMFIQSYEHTHIYICFLCVWFVNIFIDIYTYIYIPNYRYIVLTGLLPIPLLKFPAMAVVAWVCWKNWAHCVGTFATSSGIDGHWCDVWWCRTFLKVFLPYWHCWHVLPGGPLAWCNLAAFDCYSHCIGSRFKHISLLMIWNITNVPSCRQPAFCPRLLFVSASLCDRKVQC